MIVAQWFAPPIRTACACGSAATTFEQLVRSVTHVYLHYIDERGLIVERSKPAPTGETQIHGAAYMGFNLTLVPPHQTHFDRQHRFAAPERKQVGCCQSRILDSQSKPLN